MTRHATPLRLDTTDCDACGRCVARCVPRALKVGRGYIAVDWAACDGCGACAEACDRGSIVLKSTLDPQPAAKAAPSPTAKSAAKPAAKSTAKSAAGPTVSGPPAAKPPTPTGAPAWSLAEAVLVLVAAFALYLGFQSIPGGVSHAPVWAGVVLLAYNAAIASLLWFLARHRGVGVVTALRLDVPPELSSLALAAGLALGCWVVSVAYRAAAPLTGLQPPVGGGADLTTLFGAGAVGAVLTMIVVAVVGPVLEEALLRGIVLGALRGRLGVWVSIAVSAVAFSLLHASLWSFLPLTVLGVALGWLAVRSRSLWPAIVAHVVYNALFVGAALYKALGA